MEESWAPKNLCFWTVVLEKTRESPLDCKESNQSILKEISPGFSLEGLMLKLKLQYFGHLMWRVDSLEKTLMLRGIGLGGKGDDRGWDGWMASPTQWTWVWVNTRRWWWTGRPGVLRFMGLQSRIRLNDWTELKNEMSKLLEKYSLKKKYKTWLSYNYLNKLSQFKTFPKKTCQTQIISLTSDIKHSKNNNSKHSKYSSNLSKN